MSDVRVRDEYVEPEWAREERNRLADEWADSDSELDIQDYVLAHASEKYKEEYHKARQIIEAAS